MQEWRDIFNHTAVGGGLYKTPSLTRLPDYNPFAWQGAIQGLTNCFTYALNLPAHGWGLPGTLTIAGYEERKRATVRIGRGNEAQTRALLSGAVQGDRLIPVSRAAALSMERPVVSLHFGVGTFHFCRKDNEGSWSHKNGTASPQSTDDKSRIIFDPQEASFFSYPLFAGYFALPQEGLVYQQDSQAVAVLKNALEM